MVDVTGKEIQIRVAVASGEIRMQPDTIEKIQSDQVAKGNVLATARIAAICAAKKTGDLIPLCHPLPIPALRKIKLNLAMADRQRMA